MKNTFATLFIILIGSKFYAQQISLFNHYSINPYLINPARAGSSKSTTAFLLHRQQWTGIPGAPITDVLTLDGIKKSEKIGLGITISNDATNIVSKTSVLGTYAYHGKINSDNKFSLGLSAGVMQNRIQFDKVVTENYADKTLMNNLEKGTTLDVNFGSTYQWKKLDIGLTVNQLLGNKINYIQQSNFKELRWQNIRHFVITAGYTFTLKKDMLTIDPILLLRSAQGLSPQAELTALLKFKKLAWMNLSYRHESAFAIGIGVNALDNFSFGYAYEYPITKLNQFSVSTHEIMIGYKFNKGGRSNEDDIWQPNVSKPSQGTDPIILEQFDQLQQKVEELSKEIKRSRQEQQTIKEELDRKSNKEEKMFKELEKDKSDAIKIEEDTNKMIELNAIVFDTAKFNHYVVIGAYHGLNHAKHFQKTMKEGKGIDSKIMQTKSKIFYFVYTALIYNKPDAIAEINRLKKLNIEEIIKSKIWIHQETK
jgi:type IX secretion system PorP/SprF family membrane protein